MTTLASLTRRAVPMLLAAVLACSLVPIGASASTGGTDGGPSPQATRDAAAWTPDPAKVAAIPADPAHPADATEPTATPDPGGTPVPEPTAQPTPAPTATPSPTPSPEPTSAPTPTATPAPTTAPIVATPAPPAPAAAPTPSPAPPTAAVTMSQHASSYNATANTAQVSVTATPTGFTAPWQYAFAVRGTTVTSGSSSAASVSATLTNNCSITTQSITVTITDGAGHSAGAAGTLDRSLCPPPPNVPHAKDRILAGPTLTENSFVDRLRAVGSPALAEGHAIYKTMIAGGVNPAFALGTFHAESHSGTRGYAVTTKNWGNILYYSWEADYGAVPYAPGNGYTYAKYPTWLASVQAYVSLLGRYDANGYTTVSSASAHWLGTVEGSARHLTYLNNITAVMSILPDDAVPSMTALSAPAKSRANVTVSWAAKDNLGVTGYEIRARLGTGAWPAAAAVSGTSHVLTLGSGTWTVGVRATDAAANWSPWRYIAVAVDAGLPAMTGLSRPSILIRSTNGSFTASWSAKDNVAVTGYQWRLRRDLDGTWTAPVSTTARSRAFSLHAGSWYLDVRARDAVGNWSDWSETRVVIPADDRSYAFSSGMVRRTGASYYRGTVTTTSRAGSTLTTTFTGTAVYVVGTVGPSYGRLRVTIDGASWLVDTGYLGTKRATANHYRIVLFSRTVAPGAHTLTITNLATTHRPTIAVDALGYTR